MSAAPLKIVTINGSPRNPSRTHTVIEAVVDRLQEQLNATVYRVEAASLIGVPLAESAETATPELKADLHQIETADLIVAGSPVYKGAYTGIFKYLIDLVDPYSLVDVPVILVATGGSERHTLVIDHIMRPLFSFLQTATNPLGIYAHSSEVSQVGISNAALLARVRRVADHAVDTLRPGKTLRELNPASL